MQPLILVVEDDVDLGSMMAEILMFEGFAVEHILNGREAIERLEAVKPAGVLLDLHLPGASGVEILAFIRQEPRLANTFVALVTADAIRAQTLEQQADAVYIKPIDLNDLDALMQRLHQAAEG